MGLDVLRSCLDLGSSVSSLLEQAVDLLSSLYDLEFVRASLWLGMKTKAYSPVRSIACSIAKYMLA